MFKIAIIGGGLGGLFAALSIHQHLTSENIQVDVYEQAPEYKEIGAGVGIGPNAAALAVKLGLQEKLAKITEFLQVLIDTVKERAAATLHTNKHCKSLEDQGETVLLTFADGTTTSANLVIGADGIHSATRKHYV
ncbi:hypothetical protein V2G26_011398, partial [Clonostachys chloroleuca]